MAEFNLRKWQSGDEVSLAQSANNYKIWRNVKDIFPHPYTLADAYEWIKFAQNQPLTFTIEVGGKAVGGIGVLFKEDVYRHNAEIGYWLSEDYWGKGIITKAINEVVELTFDSTNIHRIYAGVFEYNIASMRVLEKAGFEKEAILKQSIAKEGKLYDEHIYCKFKL
jgi:[ribosomal protein S5]-alanine N-acetyltransferase